ncbi:hypothetical protein CDD81_5775 [Ophiocordyceps australis]|uniref:Transposase IS30-like HTH domain-containing protein n=1 Tax=Ophiocordyceps australis TaxID=1399860 RepID=A0A2C5Y956_9HYPO|nr:hypothetical protein CDD81_5775 [Ophiocordyceps australis]
MAPITCYKTIDASTPDTRADLSAIPSITPNSEPWTTREPTDAKRGPSLLPNSESCCTTFAETGASILASPDSCPVQPRTDDATYAEPSTLASSACPGSKKTLQNIAANVFAPRQKHCQFSSAQREAMCTHVSSGKSYRTVATLFKTSASTVHAIFKRWRTHRSIESKTRSGRPCKLSDEQKQQLAVLVDSHPKPTYAQLVECMGGGVSKRTIRRAIQDQQRELAAMEARQ